MAGDDAITAVERQLVELEAALGDADDRDLGSPCAGREGIGDGSVGAVAAHTIDVYRRVAAFLGGEAADTRHSHGHQAHGAPAAAGVEALRAELGTAKAELSGLAGVDLARVPPAGTFRFCDGERTLEDVILRVLGHQRHHVAAVSSELRRDRAGDRRPSDRPAATDGRRSTS